MYVCPDRRLLLWTQKRKFCLPFDWTGVNGCLLRILWRWTSLQTSRWALPFSIFSSYTPSFWTFQVPSNKTNMFVLIWAKKKATETIKENRSWTENSEDDIQKKNRVFSSGIHWVSEPFLVAFRSCVLINEGLPFPAVKLACGKCHACMSLTKVCEDTINVLCEYVFEGRFWRVGEFPGCVLSKEEERWLDLPS